MCIRDRSTLSFSEGSSAVLPFYNFFSTSSSILIYGFFASFALNLHFSFIALSVSTFFCCSPFSTSFYVMAPILIGYGQSIIDEYRKEMLVEEYLKNRGIPTTATDAPDILAQDDAEVSLETEITNSSADVTLDQSNNGCLLYTSPSPRDS